MHSLEAFGLSGKYLGGEGVGVLRPVSVDLLLRCPRAVAGEITLMPLLQRLPVSIDPTESNDDAEEMEDDLEKAKGEDVADESESFKVSGLDVIEHDKDVRLDNIVDLAAHCDKVFSPLDLPVHFFVRNVMSSVVHLCSWLNCAAAAAELIALPDPNLTAGVLSGEMFDIADSRVEEGGKDLYVEF